jgi:hypothetical protein
MTKRELYNYTGNSSQLFSLRKVQLCEGKAKGISIIEVKTVGGLSIDILPDTCLDIGQVSFYGVNVSWLSKNGYDSPFVWNALDGEFTRTFPGGLLYTCGLRSVGMGNNDGGEWFPQHGRIHSNAAENVSACIDDASIEKSCFVISGVIHETALFGCCLEMCRKITIPVCGSSIKVEDTIQNLSPNPEEFMLLYHCNFGYPLLSEDAVLELPEQRTTTPRTEFSKTGLGRECVFDKPIDGEEERGFFHQIKESKAVLRNNKLGISAAIEWSRETLPVFAEWRCMRSGDYVLGFEPSNNYIMGRSEERKNGTLKILKAWEMVTTKIELNFEEI